MATSKEYNFESKDQDLKGNSPDLPPGFKAAMRFNALQRGMKWRDTYKLTSGLSE